MPIQYQPPAVPTTPAPDPGYFQYNNAGAFGAVEVAGGNPPFAYRYSGGEIELSGTGTAADLAFDYPWMIEPVITSDLVTGIKMYDAFGSGNVIAYRPVASNVSCNFEIMPSGAQYATFAMFGTDFAADTGNFDALQIATPNSGYSSITTLAVGTGTLRQLSLSTNSDFTQLVIGTDGGVSVGTATAAGSDNLLVAGTINGSNLSGTNTGDQDLSDLVPDTRTLTINGTAQDLSTDRSWTVSVDTAADYDWTGGHSFAREALIAQTPNANFTIPTGFSMIVPSLYNLPTTTAITIEGTGILMVA